MLLELTQETDVHFQVGTVILGFLSIFKKSQASSPFEALNSVCLLWFQRDMRPPVQMRRGTRAFSRVSTGYSDIPSSCEMKDEPAFKPLQENLASFWVRVSRCPFHLRQQIQGPSHIPIAEGIYVRMTSHPVYLWHHIQYIWYHTYCFRENTTIPDISPTTFNIQATVSVSSHPLHRCHHNNYGSHHTWHAYDIIHTLYDITFTLYDINPQHLWHHKHWVHDIRSPIYDITSMVYDISSPIPVTSQPLYLKHHTHYVCEFISTIFDIKHTVLRWYNHYIWHHSLHKCICVITPTLSVI